MEKLVVKFVIILFFFIGIIVLLGFPITYIKYLIEGAIVLIFINSIQKNNQYPLIKEFAFFAISFLLATLYNNDFTYGTLTEFRGYLIPYLFFLTLIKINFSKLDYRKMDKLFFSLFILQVFASIIKLIIHGVDEKIVGTISTSGGSLHTSIPIMIYSFIVGSYLFENISKSKFNLLIFGFMIFIISGAKRAIWAYLIVMMIVWYFLYYRTYLKRKIIIRPVTISSLVIISFFLIYVGAKITPTLNPEHEVGGSFDTHYIADYVYTYNFYDSRRQAYQGRFGGTFIILKEMFTASRTWIKNKKTFSWMFGFGPSSFYGDNYLTDSDVLYETNVSYYRKFIPTGFYNALFMFGLFGTIAIILYFRKILIILKQIQKKWQNKFTKSDYAIHFALTSYFIWVFIEFFTYSATYTTYIFMVPMYYFARVYKKFKIDLRRDI